MNVEHFEKEANEIDNYIQSPKFTTTIEVKDNYYRMRRELFSVNLRLWRAEDVVRLLPEIGKANMLEIQKLAELCKTIARLNDERAGLVKSMNALYGPVTEEKIYVHSTLT